MFVIAGVTGHVGAAAAEALLARGADVRVLVRDAAKGERWAQQGAEVAVVDLADRAALTSALQGSDGCFILLPTNYAADDLTADQRRITEEIVGAVADSGVPHVVMLSSIGADLPQGTGPLVGLYELENRLRDTGVVLSAIRSGHFQEKVEAFVGVALESGIYPNFGDSSDLPVPMVATLDLGVIVAETLLVPPPANQVIDVEGPAYTERQVAEKLGAALGRPLQVVNIPRKDWVDTLVQTGLSRQIAETVAELYDADQRSILQPKGDRKLNGTTPIDETLRDFVRSIA